jgi:hypothetical protein
MGMGGPMDLPQRDQNSIILLVCQVEFWLGNSRFYRFFRKKPLLSKIFQVGERMTAKTVFESFVARKERLALLFRKWDRKWDQKLGKSTNV